MINISKVLKNYLPLLTQDFNTNHIGIDLVGNLNNHGVLDDIIAIYDGTVEKIEVNCNKVYSDINEAFKDYGHSYGCFVLINHGNINGHNYKTRYAHLEYRSNSHLYVGMKIKKGDKIGYMGNTGYTFGGHLHFELIKDEITINPYILIFNNYELNDLDKPIYTLPNNVLRDNNKNQFEVLISNLNVRKGPGTDYEVVYYPCKEGIYNVLNKENDWYMIKENMWINSIGGKYYPVYNVNNNVNNNVNTKKTTFIKIRNIISKIFARLKKIFGKLH